MSKPKVLVVCIGNSMRSQMAEGVLRDELGDLIEITSAGTEPCGVYPMAMAVLNEVGIDTSKHHSKSVFNFANTEFDLVITLCDGAKRSCPTFTKTKKQVHHPYHDPIHLRPGEDELDVFRNLRDRMRSELKEIVIQELNLTPKQ